MRLRRKHCWHATGYTSQGDPGWSYPVQCCHCGGEANHGTTRVEIPGHGDKAGTIDRWVEATYGGASERPCSTRARETSDGRPT